MESATVLRTRTWKKVWERYPSIFSHVPKTVDFWSSHAVLSLLRCKIASMREQTIGKTYDIYTHWRDKPIQIILILINGSNTACASPACAPVCVYSVFSSQAGPFHCVRLTRVIRQKLMAATAIPREATVWQQVRDHDAGKWGHRPIWKTGCWQVLVSCQGPEDFEWCPG